MTSHKISENCKICENAFCFVYWDFKMLIQNFQDFDFRSSEMILSLIYY